MSDMYRVCRWCRHFQGGKCHRGVFKIDALQLYEVSESGQLSEVIEETLNSISLDVFTRSFTEKLREWKVSQKRIEEFLDLFKNLYLQHNDFEVKLELDGNITSLYSNFAMDLYNESYVEIDDPETFYCKEWE